MTAEPILVLAWLVLAHLVADFVLQTGRIARAKASTHGSAPGMLAHGALVALTLVPVGVAFGGPGWIVAVVVTLSHVVIDRAKVVLTRRAEARALADARRRHESTGRAPDGLGPAWTPMPAALFAFDQAAHVLVLLGAWLAWLSPAPLQAGFTDWVASVTSGWDQALVHATLVRGVVLASLVIVNVRAGALFVSVLVGSGLSAEARRPAAGAGAGKVAVGGPTDEPATTAAAVPAASGPAAAAAPVRSRGGWTLRLGPLIGRAEPDPAPVEPVASASAATPAGHAKPAPPARVGEAIGILERLLVATFVLVGAEAAIGLVIAAKTLARFRQLDDRDFAEYYLLGTLASVAIAAISAFAAVAVLDTVG